MEDIRTRPLTRGQIGDFISSERGVRSYEDMQSDIGTQHEALTTASFLVVSSETALGAERALTIGAGLHGDDGGPNGAYTLTNTAPDQVVTLVGAGTTSITGTYPNFTITSNDQFVGTVTSVDASGGTTGLTFTGGPVTGSGVLTLGGILGAANGGTSFSSYAAGDLIYATGATAMAKLAIGANLTVLTSNGIAPVWTASTGTGNIARATSPTFVTPVLGTPTSGTLTNCSGLPIATGVSGLGANVAAFLATPSSANLAAAVTNETGTGALVFASSPQLTSPGFVSVPSTAWGADFGTGTGNLITIAASGTYDLAVGSGMVILYDDAGGGAGLFMAWYGVTAIVLQSGSLYTITGGTASKVNFYYDGGTGKYRIQNNTAGSLNIHVTTIRCRTSS